MKWNKCERPDMSDEQKDNIKKIFGPNFEHFNVQMKVKMRTKRNWRKIWERNKYTVYGLLTGILGATILTIFIQLYR